MSDDIDTLSLQDARELLREKHKQLNAFAEMHQRAEARVRQLDQDNAVRALEVNALRADLEAAMTKYTDSVDIAAARTVQVHTLVQEVVEKATRWYVAQRDGSDDGESEGVLLCAVSTLHAAGITIQPVRTLSEAEADALLQPLALISKDNQARELRAIRNALMGVPQVTTPPAVSQGHDEAGGEGAASAYDEVDEIKRALDGADDVLRGIPADKPTAASYLVRAVRLINAKVDSLAKRT